MKSGGDATPFFLQDDMLKRKESSGLITFEARWKDNWTDNIQSF